LDFDVVTLNRRAPFPNFLQYTTIKYNRIKLKNRPKKAGIIQPASIFSIIQLSTPRVNGMLE